MTIFKTKKLFTKLKTYNSFKGVYSVNKLKRRIAPSKKEGLLGLNAKINSCYFSKNVLAQKNKVVFFKDLQHQSFLIHILRKYFVLNKFGLKKQYIYLLIDIILALSKMEKTLLFSEIFSYDFKTTSEYKYNSLIYNDFMFNFVFQRKNHFTKRNINAQLSWVKIFESFNLIGFKFGFAFLLNTLQIKPKFSFYFLPEYLTVEKIVHLNHFKAQTELYFNSRALTFYKNKFISNLWLNDDLNINSSFTKNFLSSRLINLSTQNKFAILFKKGALGFNTQLKYNLKHKRLNFFKSFSNQNLYKKEIAKSILYLIQKLDEKRKFILDNKLNDNVISIRNFFLTKALEKSNNTLGFGLSTDDIFDTLIQYIRTPTTNLKKESTVVPHNLNLIENLLDSIVDDKETIEYYNFLKLKPINLRNKKLNFYHDQNIQKKQSFWKQKKLVGLAPNVSFLNIHKYFSLLFGQESSVIFINALALTKFAYGYPVKKKGAQRFLSYIEREMIQRYKYVAIYIQDFIRVCFLSFFLKKPTFIANFIGFQLAHLPRNRKETQFIRFLIKVIKIFGAQRKEVLAVKIEFKGRVNRWRRTKIIRGSRGVISFFRYTTRIEYGSGKAITRKGALGIRLWISYKVSFNPLFREILLSYIEYSRFMRMRSINKFLFNFKSKSTSIKTW